MKHLVVKHGNEVTTINQTTKIWVCEALTHTNLQTTVFVYPQGTAYVTDVNT